MRERVDLKSPVREYRPPGSVRGASGNRRPYLDTADSRQQTAESRKQVRSEKACVAEGESPSSLEAKLPEFRTKVMNGKV
jgi:hypothetical protein